MGNSLRILIAFLALLIPSTSFACSCVSSAAETEESAFKRYEQVALITVLKAEFSPHGGVVGWGEVFLNLKGNSFMKVRLESLQPLTSCSVSTIEVGGRYLAFIEPEGVVKLGVCTPSTKQEYVASEMLIEKINKAILDHALKMEASQTSPHNSRDDKL